MSNHLKFHPRGKVFIPIITLFVLGLAPFRRFKLNLQVACSSPSRIVCVRRGP